MKIMSSLIRMIGSVHHTFVVHLKIRGSYIYHKTMEFRIKQGENFSLTGGQFQHWSYSFLSMHEYLFRCANQLILP